MVKLFMIMLYLLLLLRNYASGTFDDTPEIIVQTEDGVSYQGYENEIYNVYEFLGIPYASLPRERNKFKAPLPPVLDERYKAGEVFKADKDNIYCPQNVNNLPQKTTFTEDCLVLNIFIPTNRPSTLPVVMYIHGGPGFDSGHSLQRVPLSLANESVIGITFNYRLGMHGFLCLKTEMAPGNAALRDVLTAIRWVKKYIGAFNGNPKKITLAGYGFGATIAEMVYLSQNSSNTADEDKLFQQVILDSSFGSFPYAIQENPLELARSTAFTLAGNNITDMEALEEFYLNLSYEDMFRVSYSEQFSPGFGPCIEDRLNSVNIVLEYSPLQILYEEQYLKIPILIGNTNAEGLFFYNNYNRWKDTIEENISDFIPSHFTFNDISTKKVFTTLLQRHYFTRNYRVTTLNKKFVNYFTDSVFYYWTIFFARFLAGRNQSVFLYQYAYEGSLDPYTYKNMGASHCSQMYYILDDRTGPEELTTEENFIKKFLIKEWSNFIKNGAPSSIWTALDANKLNHLLISGNISMVKMAQQRSIDIWDSFMFLLPRHDLKYTNLRSFDDDEANQISPRNSLIVFVALNHLILSYLVSISC